jgi:hypothetical protein
MLYGETHERSKARNLKAKKHEFLGRETIYHSSRYRTKIPDTGEPSENMLADEFVYVAPQTQCLLLTGG